MHALIPLLILFLFIIIAGVVGFVVYTIATDIAAKTSKKMEDHNVQFGKDGLKISVKEMKNEDYVDKTQNVLVKAWNLSTWPAYKSRFWNQEKVSGKKGSSSKSPRVGGSSSSRVAPGGVSGSSSSSHTHSRTEQHHHSHGSSNARLAEPRPAARRTVSGSPIPGAFD